MIELYLKDQQTFLVVLFCNPNYIYGDNTKLLPHKAGSMLRKGFLIDGETNYSEVIKGYFPIFQRNIIHY